MRKRFRVDCDFSGDRVLVSLKRKFRNFLTSYRTIPLVYEVILMILALYKAAAFWGASGGFTGFELVKVLIIDQVIYFAL